MISPIIESLSSVHLTDVITIQHLVHLKDVTTIPEADIKIKIEEKDIVWVQKKENVNGSYFNESCVLKGKESDDKVEKEEDSFRNISADNMSVSSLSHRAGRGGRDNKRVKSTKQARVVIQCLISQLISTPDGMTLNLQSTQD